MDPTESADLTSGWKCYAITTADRPDRAARLDEELQKLGLPYLVQLNERPDDDGGFINVGTFGCFAAHLASLRRAREEGVSVAVLVEDDAVVVRRFARLLPVIAEEIADTDWSMLYLGYLVPQSPIAGQEISMVSRHVAVARGWEVAGSHFVAIRGSDLDAVIENLEERLEPGGHRIPLDGVLNEFRRDHDRDTLVCLPNLSRQGPMPSGITERPGWRTRLLQRAPIRRVAWPLKRVWWDLISLLPPSLLVRHWNRRAVRIGKESV